MTKKIVFYLLIFLSFSCKKETNQELTTENKIIRLPPKIIIDENTVIGFACYNSGKKSEPVKKFSKILVEKKYPIILKELNSINIADKYLATVICEKLLKKKLINLTEKEINQIKKNKNSNESVNTCAGCTNQEKMTLKELFTAEKNYIAEETEDWLNEMIK
jgi:hypothetical protein